MFLGQALAKLRAGQVLEVAVAGEAKLIVTHNLKDFGKAADFGIRALSPAEFLKMIGEKNEHD